jgi:ABC-2 type transport system permease protein
MKTIIYIIRKEFIQIFRNKTMLPLIFIMPIMQLLVLVYTASLEMKHINMVIVDNDLSENSRQLISKFDASPFFYVKGHTSSPEEANGLLARDEEHIVLVIPNGFGKDLLKEGHTDIQLLVNAINATTAGLTYAYTSNVIADYNRSVLSEYRNFIKPVFPENIHIDYSYWFNPQLDYKIFMLPGLLVILVTMIGMFLTALNIVREKELGTMEQINVTPIVKYQFIVGKLVPFWAIGIFELAFGLTVGKLLFDIPMLGSLFTLFGFVSVYLLVALGIGLLISTLANTQQQVMFIVFFFMLTFILMSGIFTPTESMPKWAQYVNLINPYAYFMRVIRMVLLKGSGFWDISREFFSLVIYAIVVLGLAVWRYRKTV